MLAIVCLLGFGLMSNCLISKEELFAFHARKKCRRVNPSYHLPECLSNGSDWQYEVDIYCDLVNWRMS
jgi:hypothetical protein